MWWSIRPLVLLAAFAAVACGQNTASWFWTISDSGDGDGVIEPAESALLTLWCSFDPPQPQEGGGFAGAIYDIIGDDEWAQGTVESYSNLLTDGVGGYGSRQPDNDITNIQNFQLPLLANDFFDPSNPVDLYFVEWTPHSYHGQSILLDNGGPDVDVYTDSFGTSILYSGADGAVTFRVAPSPGVAQVGLLAIIMNMPLLRRR